MQRKVETKTSTIWKFPLTVEDQQILRMPLGAQILAVQVQRGIPCVWAIVDPDAPFEGRTIKIIGTGHPVNPDGCGRYLGTFQMTNLNLVFHVFDDGPV